MRCGRTFSRAERRGRAESWPAAVTLRTVCVLYVHFAQCRRQQLGGGVLLGQARRSCRRPGVVRRVAARRNNTAIKPYRTLIKNRVSRPSSVASSRPGLELESTLPVRPAPWRPARPAPASRPVGGSGRPVRPRPRPAAGAGAGRCPARRVVGVGRRLRARSRALVLKLSFTYGMSWCGHSTARDSITRNFLLTLTTWRGVPDPRRPVRGAHSTRTYDTGGFPRHGDEYSY